MNKKESLLLEQHKKEVNNNFLLMGIDEAGRGALAGPLVVAGVILPINYFNEKINDSKKLSEKIRENLFSEIINKAISYKIEVISNLDIENLNPLQATIKGAKNILKEVKYDFTIIDSLKINEKNCVFLNKADENFQSVGAASILAKVTRDRIMVDYHKKWPSYDFDKNKGYGTKKHIDTIYKSGFIDIHRKTYEPIKSIIKKGS